MRILHIIPQFPYFGGRTIVGGHASCLLTLALAQHQAGEQVSILSYIRGRRGPFQIEGGPVAHGLFEHSKTRTVRFGLQFCRTALEWIESRRDAFDVIHMHSGYADYFMVSARIRSVIGLPTLHTLYCPIPETGGRVRLPGVHSIVKHWANQLDWRGGISENVTASMVNYGMQNVGQIRPAVDIGRFSPNKEIMSIRKKMGLKADDLVVLFVGNAKPQKNAIGVLRAVHEIRGNFPAIKLVVTTELKHSSSDVDLARLAEVVRELELESCVIQMGIINDMPILMRACDVLVAPFFDSYGPSDYFMVALEAMACGKPVVVSRVGGMPEIISNEVGRLVDPHDISSIASGLSIFLADKALRLRTGFNARVYVEQYFHPDKNVSAYQDIYRRISL